MHAGGRETVDDPGRSGSHDDLANVVSAAAVLASEASVYEPTCFGGFGVYTSPRLGALGSGDRAADEERYVGEGCTRADVR